MRVPSERAGPAREKRQSSQSEARSAALPQKSGCTAPPVRKEMRTSGAVRKGNCTQSVHKHLTDGVCCRLYQQTTATIYGSSQVCKASAHQTKEMHIVTFGTKEPTEITRVLCKQSSEV